MALATRCPHCHTTFRVAHDQLKLRAGLVRCGACKEIFNGVEHLLSASVPPQTANLQASAAFHGPASSSALQGRIEQTPHQQPAVAPENTVSPASEKQISKDENSGAPAEHPETSGATDTNVNADPLQRMTLMDFSAWKEVDEIDPALRVDHADADHAQRDDPATYSQTEQPAEASDELDRAIEDLQRKPWRRKNAKSNIDDDIEGDEDTTEPDFVRRARRQQQIGRTLRILASVGSVLLMITLVGQTVYAFRNQIAAWLPQATPMLIQACARVGCDVGLPTQIDAVSIESSELQSLVPNQNTFVLNTLLRNRSSIAQAWPSIELTLNDANEKAIARRVFSPREYLVSANDLSKGFGPNSEQAIRVFFELSDLKASGYRVYLFYP
ncbi:MAG: hypothetical protein A3I66_19865 [Burkholderiales bacterium RIFCSPLOWO2_02_FULL_57_36]|nr:MAG: hypothetical protein A3I66_19865 [Burkholderiales bacterium RIFCSPLOWO2_02_FULL_57_36]